MTSDQSTFDANPSLRDPAIVSLVAGRIEELRKRLLDFSRRNPLVNISFRPTSASVIRVVDELPDILRLHLSQGAGMRIAPLPPIEDDPKDEQSDRFLNAFFLARREDAVWLDALGKLEADDPKYAEKERVLEREARDRVREALRLPKRQAGKTVALDEHARANGIDPSFDLPDPDNMHEDGRHSDTTIQTLMLPDKLRRTGKSITERGRAFERETGVNVQHVVLGILEWKSPDEREKFLSPLLLVEARLERVTSVRGEEYVVRGAGPVTTNATLRQKLHAEHRLDLPEFEAGSAEEYFDRIGALVPAGWTWRVRRQAVIGIFPSNRIAMYHDLDPAKRPLAEQDLVARLLASSGVSDGGETYAGEYEPDAPEIASVAPYTVLDADASQHSALVDIARARSLAIEGPPGSGKSQTIVNIIAAALAAGKKVLFVAEKLTALDVVKNRLEAVGLGEFILPLQAGKSTADQVYASLDARLHLARGNAQEEQQSFDTAARLLVKQKATLQDYLDTLAAPFGNTGSTVHELLGHAIALAAERRLLPKHVARTDIPRISDYSRVDLDQLVADAQALSERLVRMERMPRLWMLSGTSIFNNDTARDLADEAGEIADLLDRYRAEFAATEFAGLHPEDAILLDMEAVSSGLVSLRDLLADIGRDAVRGLTDPSTRDRVLRHAALARSCREGQDALSKALVDPDAAGETLAQARAFALDQGGTVNPALHRADLDQCREDARRVAAALAAWELLDPIWKNARAPLSAIVTLAAQVRDTPPEVLALRSLKGRAAVDDAATWLRQKTADLDRRLARIRTSLRAAGSHSLRDVLDAAGTIEASGAFRFLSGPYKHAVSFYRSGLDGPADAPRDAMVRDLRDYAAWLEDAETFAGDVPLAERFGGLFRGRETDTGLIMACVDYCGAIEDALPDDAGLRALLWSKGPGRLVDFQVPEDCADETYGNLLDLARELADEAIGLEGLLSDATRIVGRFRNTASVPSGLIDQIATGMDELAANRSRLQADAAIPGLEALMQGEATDDARVLELSRTVQDLGARLGDGFLATVLALPEPDRTVESSERLLSLYRRVFRDMQALASALDFKGACRSGAEIAALQPHLRIAAADPDALLDRAFVRRSEGNLRKVGLSDVVDWAMGEGRETAREKLPLVVRTIVAKNLVDEIYRQHGTILQDYAGEDLDRMRRELCEKDRRQIHASCRVVRASLISRARPPGGVGIGRKSDFTELSLILNEIAKKRNRVPLRELTRRSGQALMELKPCWMMSPLAVSQFLQTARRFDLVVIDEASQMTPENALGAISRARQAVIVGDTKQLPPSSFFQRVIDDADVDDDLREDSESILDLANMAFMPVRQLRWHYRSQHSDLIRFSNHWLYGDKLTIFPCADEKHAKLGVELVRVPGTYKGRANPVEADRIVKAAIRFMEESPDLSLGICTMNGDQRDLIEEEIDRERVRNPLVQDYITRWEEENNALEGFFVKNLETIQGDERDVMFISTLYGPEILGGRPAQRFGPINTAQGHRRLNVLFTRAKKKIVTFTSLDPTDILVDEGKSKGVRMFRAWLEYCATGVLGVDPLSSGSTESPFEDHIVRLVESLGFEAVPQVGSGGYRIDIGVRHADWPHGYVLGIECDGAAYHSGRTARDRDRLRQEILERLGWSLHRIWSTDWYNNPAKELGRLKEVLDARLAALKAAPTRKSHSSFNDLMETTPKPAPGPAATDRGPPSARSEPAQSSLDLTFKEGLSEPAATGPAGTGTIGTEAPAEDATRRVKVGSRVTIQQRDGAKEKLTFTISTKGTDLEKGFLAKDAPLALAVLDLEEDEEFEYQSGVKVREGIILKIA